MALITLLNRLITSLINGEYILAYFPKTFDIDGHVLLLRKLTQYGIKGTAGAVGNHEQYSETCL